MVWLMTFDIDDVSYDIPLWYQKYLTKWKENPLVLPKDTWVTTEELKSELKRIMKIAE